MRVISGSARSLRLKTLPGDSVRPTSDRNKETLFNMIAPLIPGCSFLDIFAGSGAIGIEALSRGAARAYFIERDAKAVNVIKENLAFTHLEENADILEYDYSRAISMLKGEHFDIIFMDPPFNRDIEKDALKAVAESDLLEDEGVVILEADVELPTDFIEGLGFRIIKVKEYKNVKHILAEKIKS